RRVAALAGVVVVAPAAAEGGGAGVAARAVGGAGIGRGTARGAEDPIAASAGAGTGRIAALAGIVVVAPTAADRGGAGIARAAVGGARIGWAGRDDEGPIIAASRARACRGSGLTDARGVAETTARQR